VSPKFLAIVAVFGIALYLIFGNKVAGSTAITGSTALPTPLSTAGGIGSLEGSFASLLTSLGAGSTPVPGSGGAPASQGTGGTVVTAANQALYPNVPIGATVGGSTDTTDVGGSLSSVLTTSSGQEYYSAAIGTESVANPNLLPTTASTTAPTAPVVNTPASMTNVLPFQQTLGSAQTPSLDATNLSIGYVAPPPGLTSADSNGTFEAGNTLDDGDSLGVSLG
jgi:hypothetical protein